MSLTAQELADILIADGTFTAIVERLYAEKFTGETVIHWAQGHPQSVEIPQQPVRIPLDRRRRPAQT